MLKLKGKMHLIVFRWVGMRSAMHEVRLSRSTILKNIREGNIKAEKCYSPSGKSYRWLIHDKSLMDFIAKRLQDNANKD